MRLLLILFALLQVATGTAWADIIIALDNPTQSGNPGDTLIFMGVLSNNGPNTVFLNSADLNLAGNSFTPDFIDPFLNNVPLSLDPGQSTLDIELFDVAINSPFTDLPGTFAGTYALVGGVDSNAQDVLNSAGFTATVPSGPTPIPEPSSVALLGAALVATWRALRHRRPAC